MPKKKICLYTCITGNYDSLIEIENKESNVDYICFTNNRYINSKTWKVIYLDDREISDHYLSRRIKMFATPELREKYDMLIYIDSNVKFNCNINDFLNEDCNLKDYDFIGLKHFARNSIKEEAEECLRVNKDDEKIIKNQMSFYKKEKFPDDLGLCEMCVFVWNPKSKTVMNTMKLWYDMIVKYSKRDQLSFMYSAYKSKLKLQILPYDITNDKRFIRVNHRKLVEYFYYVKDKNNEFTKRYKGALRNVKENLYETTIKFNSDCDVIKFEVENEKPLMVGDIRINGKKIKYKSYIEYETLKNYKVYFGNLTSIFIPYEYKKNNVNKLLIEFKYMGQEEYISYIEAFKNLINNLSKSVEEKDFYIKNLEDNIKNLEDNLSNIVNSKGWKLLEKIRNIRR